MAALTKPLPPLPDLAIHQILRSLPSKDAVRMSFLSKQHQGAWVSLPLIDLVECGEPDNDDDDDEANGPDQHTRFRNMLERYLECREEGAQQKPHDALLKFRLVMFRYKSEDDAAIVDKWLNFAFKKSVKELDISLGNRKLARILDEDTFQFYHCFSRATFVNARSITTLVQFYHRLSRATFVNARSITSLNLEYVQVNRGEKLEDTKLLPCLKSMSLKYVHFCGSALRCLIFECPSIKYLSIISCSFTDNLVISNSSLKTLQFTNCGLNFLDVEAESLESLSITSSEFVRLHGIFIRKSNLKHLEVRARHLKSFILSGCHEKLQAVFDTPDLDHLLTVCYLKSKFYIEAINRKNRVTIILWDVLWVRGISPAMRGRWEHFDALRNFLQQFSCTSNLVLYSRSYQDLIFPENFRDAFPCPVFPNVEELEIIKCNPPAQETDIIDHFNLLDKCRPQVTRINTHLSNPTNVIPEINSHLSKSLLWLAPSLNWITTKQYPGVTENTSPGPA